MALYKGICQMKQDNRYLLVPQTSPLSLEDNSSQTYGCRHTNPNICGSNNLGKVCAFVREDHICKKPPRTWRLLFEKLSKQRG